MQYLMVTNDSDTNWRSSCSILW